VAVRDWQGVEARLRARADGLRRAGARTLEPRAEPGHPWAERVDAAGRGGLLFHDRPVAGPLSLDDPPGGGPAEDRRTVPADGSCVDCRAAITPERLRAAPEAVRCLRCQRAREALGPDSGPH
jgi:hypothetical protein